MKSQHLLTLSIGTFIVLLLLTFYFSKSNQVRAVMAPPIPTAAPPPTAGAALPEPEGVYPPLAEPVTRAQAIKYALAIDSQWAVRTEPLSLDTLTSRPELVTAVWHSDRSYDGFEYAPSAERGPVWVVTLKGPVRVTMVGMREDGPHLSDGVTYTIAQRTGHLLSIVPGPLIAE
jgi:hypothetical protein